MLGDRLGGVIGVRGLADDFDLGVRGEQSAQLGTGEPFIVDQQCLHRGIRSRAVTRPASGSSNWIERHRPRADGYARRHSADRFRSRCDRRACRDSRPRPRAWSHRPTRAGESRRPRLPRDAMLDRIFDQRLHEHRRDGDITEVRRDILRDPQPFFETDRFDPR